MKDSELANKAIEYLAEQDKTNRSRSRRFAPKEMTDAIGGVHTAVGRVADQVVTELIARGVNIRYVRSGNNRYFELL